MREWGDGPTPRSEGHEGSGEHAVMGAPVPFEEGREDPVSARDRLAGMYAELGRTGDAVQLWLSVLDERLRDGSWLEALRICKLLRDCAPGETSGAERFSAAAQAAPDEAPPLYGALGAGSLHATLAVMRCVVAPAGTVVAVAGAAGESALLVLRGALRCTAPAGESAVRSRQLRAGDTCFDAALVVSMARTLTVTALEETVYFELPRAGFHEVTQRFPDALAALREVQKRRLVDGQPARAPLSSPANAPLPVETALALGRSERNLPAAGLGHLPVEVNPTSAHDASQGPSPRIAGRLTRGWLWLALLAGGVIAYERGAFDGLGAGLGARFGIPAELPLGARPMVPQALHGSDVEGQVAALFGAGAPNSLRRERPVVDQVAPGISFDEHGELVGNAAVMERLRRESEGGEGASSPRLARAAALVEQAPTASLALLPDGDESLAEDAEKRYRALIRARALDVLGRPLDAVATLRDLSLEVPFHQGLEAKQLELRVRSGRCIDGLPNARRLAADGGIEGTLAYLRLRLLCFGLVDEVIRDAGTLLALPRLPSLHQAQLHGMVALAHLQRDDVGRAFDACRKMTTLDPSHLETALVAARCAALGDLPVRADGVAPPRYDAERWVVSVAHLQRGETPPSWPDAPAWHRGTAFLRALEVLPKRGPIAAVDEARGALLAPPWDGSPVVPLTYTELAAVVGWLPSTHRAFAEALARALVGRTVDDDTREPWSALLKASVVYADRLHRTRRSTALPEAEALLIEGPELRRSALARYLRSDARRAEAFLRDPQLAPLAAYEAGLRGGKTSLETPALVARHRHHPWLAALELHLRER